MAKRMMQPRLYTQASDKRKGVRKMKGKYSRRVAALILIGGMTIGLLWYFAQILYLFAMIDCFAEMGLGWTIGAHPTLI